MDNQEILATPVIQDTGQRQTHLYSEACGHSGKLPLPFF